MSEIENYMDNEIKPTTDYFKYATGHWLDYHPQPLEYPKWDTFHVINEDNMERIRRIITKPSNTLISKKINDYYKLVRNYTKRKTDGIKPLSDYIMNNIMPLRTKEDIMMFSAKHHLNFLFDTIISTDDKDSTNNVVYIYQNGMILGNKDYYLIKNDNNKKILKAYQKFFTKVWMYVMGADRKSTFSEFRAMLKIEKRIAKRAYSMEELTEPSLNYHKKYVKTYSNNNVFDLGNYLKAYGYDNTKSVVVCQLSHFNYIVKQLLRDIDVEKLRTMLIFYLIYNSCGLLDEKIYHYYFKFSKVMTGAIKPVPKNKRAINRTNNVFADAIGIEYANRYFNEKSKDDVTSLVHNLINAYKEIIMEQSWLTVYSKKLALQKLDNLIVKVGYPDEIDDYSNIPVDTGKSLFENNMEIAQYMFNKDKEKHYNKPVDRNEWLMPAQMVNAYYNPTTNEICFPAGILQNTFYQYGRPVEYNYGSIGAVIGHEMTHGFDNHGRQYDIDGNLKMWWSDEEVNEFNKLTENTVKRFNSLDVLPGLKCNGTYTLGENLADIGGLKIAYRACEKVLGADNEEWKEGFFLAYAVNYAGVNTEEGIRDQTLNDCHSVGYMRVNGTLPTFQPWKSYYKPDENDTLFVKDEDMAQIW